MRSTCENLAVYQDAIRLERPPQPPRIGIQPYTGPNEAFFFFNALVERLATSPAVEEVRTNYVAREGDSFLPDLVLSIDHRLQYRSSGWNFLVNWPGFAVFMPGWIGYGYHADIETHVTIHDAQGALVARKVDPPGLPHAPRRHGPHRVGRPRLVSAALLASPPSAAASTTRSASTTT